jgi:DNA-binding response OmpR family regulator
MPLWSRPLLFIDLREDEAQTRDQCRALLENAGYRVETATATADALAHVGAGAIDLVIYSPARLGVQELDFCRQLRALEGTVHLPIVVLAPYAVARAGAEGLLTSADDYVTLPLKDADLLDRVQLWLWIRQRLRGTYGEAWPEPAPDHVLEHYAWQQRRAQDVAALAMARTVSDQLRQPLTALAGWLELWHETGFEEETPEYWYTKFRAATDSLTARLDALSHIIRFEPRSVAGQVQVDVVRGQMLSADRGPTIQP